MLEYAKFAHKTFRERKMRSLLTVIGIFIGIALIVTLISLGQGLQRSINEQFEFMGMDKIMIFPGTDMLFGMGQAGPELTKDDLDVVEKVPGIKLAAGMAYKLAQVKFGDETKYTFVIGLPVDETKRIIESIQNFKIFKGRDLEKGDTYTTVIGIRLYEKDFFSKKVDIRDKLTIEGKEFKVAGAMDRIGNPADDSQVYIPIEIAGEIFDEPDIYGILFAQVSEGVNPENVAEKIKKELRKSRNVEEGEEDFTVQTSAQLMEVYGNITLIVQAILIGLAVISLLVGGIGIMNTMYTSVLERTREIGLMKAIGAKRSNIALVFLFEAGILGLIGGAIGTAFGIGVSKAVELGAAYAGYGIIKIYFSPFLIIGAILFSFVVGAVSGLLPALQAAKLSPIEALRYE